MEQLATRNQELQHSQAALKAAQAVAERAAQMTTVEASKALVKQWAKLSPEVKKKFNEQAADFNKCNGV